MGMQVNIDGIWKSISNDSSGGGNVIVGTATTSITSSSSGTTTKISFTPTQTGLVMVCGTSTSATDTNNIFYVGACTSGTEISFSKSGACTYTIKYIIFY